MVFTMRLVNTTRALRARFLRAITLAVNNFVSQITRLRASHLLNQTESTQTFSTENHSETFGLRSTLAWDNLDVSSLFVNVKPESVHKAISAQGYED